jgi:TM2 domain-containing membrane protein YozV
MEEIERVAGPKEAYCKSCGKIISKEAEICPHCGVRQKAAPSNQTMKNPGVAAAASFLFTGLGQVYNGEIGKGLLLIFVQIINLFLMLLVIGFITAPLVWIYGIYDAYKTAEKINAEIMRTT